MKEEIRLTYEEMHKKYPEWFHNFYDRIKSKRIYSKRIARAIIKYSKLKKKSIRLLLIGAGYGARDIPILKELLKVYNINLDYLDPSRDHFEKFMKNLIRYKINPNNLKIRKVHITTWQKFHSEEKYDLILAIHSWYGIYNYDNEMAHIRNMQKLFSFLEDEGVIGVVLADNTSDFRKFQIKFIAFKSRTVDTKIIQKILKKLRITYKKIENKFYFDLTGCINYFFRNKRYIIDQRGKNMINYTIQILYDSMTEDKKREINQTLLNLGYFKNGKFCVNATDSLILFGRKGLTVLSEVLWSRDN